MNSEKVLPLVKGAVKYLPGVKKLLAFKRRYGSASQSNYCYTIWMRHLHNWAQFNQELPKIVAEVGPGSSLGTSLAALLSGCEKIHALEAFKYWDKATNLRIFEELVVLFKNRAAIPSSKDYPLVKPDLEQYNFPFSILSENQLKEALAEDRLNKIRAELQDIDNPNNTMIQFHTPWYEASVIQPNSIDFIFSQAVLQAVDDLENTYLAMNQWIKPNGLMSHTIDFKSMNTTREWNGHWTYTDLEWKIVKGGSSFLINRQPRSVHLNLLDQFDFELLSEQRYIKENHIKKEMLFGPFKKFTAEDLTTSGVYILARKKL